MSETLFTKVDYDVDTLLAEAKAVHGKKQEIA